MSALISASKKNGTLELKELSKGWETRNKCVLELIKLCDEKYNLPDFEEITIHTGDGPQHYAKFSCTVNITKKNKNWDCFPDFCFINWPVVHVDDYENTCNEMDTEINLEKYDELKVGWIGNVFKYSKPRNELYNLGKQYPHLLDIKQIDTRTYGINANMKLKNCYKDKHNFMSFVEMANKYAFLLDIQGGGYSGRLKFLLHTGRPVFIVDRVCQEFFFEYLEEYKHYIPVKFGCVDLIEKVNWAINNFEKAKQIGLNGKKFAKTYLKRDNALLQIKKLLTN